MSKHLLEDVDLGDCCILELVYEDPAKSASNTPGDKRALFHQPTRMEQDIGKRNVPIPVHIFKELSRSRAANTARNKEVSAWFSMNQAKGVSRPSLQFIFLGQTAHQILIQRGLSLL